MPEIRYYTVIQEREIRISANEPVDAANLAKCVLSGTMKPEDHINVQQTPRELSIFIKEIGRPKT